MSAFRLKRQLWRRWRRWKKALWAGTACSMLILIAWSGFQVPERMSKLLTGAMTAAERTYADWSRQEVWNQQAAAVFRGSGAWNTPTNSNVQGNDTLRRAISESGLSRRVHYTTKYVSGDEVTEGGTVMKSAEVLSLLDQHPEWDGTLDSTGDLWLKRTVNDLSPDCKREAYIGIDQGGNLTLFKGPPKQEEVLKTFFQIDIGTMKSSLPEKVWKQLQGGIRIQDMEEYNSVLSTFSDFARDSDERAM
ncbi:BofC C-terminal domain-containing protein [Paenibacillus sp. HN-1]|uniref:BofC C-terminal domain-containing protein n=1 Tax=Paenibacillus TaxID=44249 RepID=UPI001CA901B3|nr:MULTISPECIES: BofC C-terminal domain-containing protein [Paenibacillus]MBY9082629.1 BofC C-terminal domain-containing protein [Paenibacillus sp. CGMCC 1.18879]MBY9085738.1 BofC C-terminal domain-containing protein [Paenibacillus sinensis]